MASVSYPRTFRGFLNWKPETRYKYEWNKGKIEKFERNLSLYVFLTKNLNRLFMKTAAFDEGGCLFTNAECIIADEKLRKPDLSFYTKQQIAKAAKGNNQVPAFVIEIISPTDNQTKILEKNQEYFSAGVKVIWLIMPNLKQVHVFTSPKHVQICTDDDVCSASPVLDDFQISVNDLLQVPS